MDPKERKVQRAGNAVGKGYRNADMFPSVHPLLQGCFFFFKWLAMGMGVAAGNAGMLMCS